jgi:ABC-type antimicrobial peptide transport system, permease component
VRERKQPVAARSLLRRHEITMRLALGAGRRRLIKQLFTEGLILSVIAAVGGIAVAYCCRTRSCFRSLRPRQES